MIHIEKLLNVSLPFQTHLQLFEIKWYFISFYQGNIFSSRVAESQDFGANIKHCFFILWAWFLSWRIPGGSVGADFSRYTAEYIACISMRTAASGRGSTPRFYCHRSTHYIVHCVGDVIKPAWRGLNSYYCRHALSAMYSGVKSVWFDGVTQYPSTRPGWISISYTVQGYMYFSRKSKFFGSLSGPVSSSAIRSSDIIWPR
jgi:hypothetical protein